MSGKVSGMVWELDIPHEHAWLLMSLADHAEHDGTSVRPGGGLTAWKTGYTVRHVKRLTKDLLETYDLLGVVDVGGGAKPAEYRIKIENFENHKKPERKYRGRPHKTHDTGAMGKEKPMTSNEKPMTSTRAPVETSIETSSYSRRDDEACSSSLKGDPAAEKKNWFSVVCERFVQVGLPVSDEDRDRLPGNLVACQMKEGATDVEMHRLIGHLVDRRLAGVVLSPQEALKDARAPRKATGVHRPPDPVGVSTAGYRRF